MLKSIGDNLLAFFEILLLGSLLSFYIVYSNHSKREVESIASLMPEGSCLTIYASKPIYYNDSIHGYSITLCKNGSRVEVVKP
ncbi:hypothetical protein MA03_06335 [Infirmifilum uzonense]|uniref:Uncharacterized protein n=1 Tax=Infirmifilum uzonense TaxID=1550241 RepID=A0A0F7FIB9_9CREN|nr:hypothetical protein MA03_06335 [Infirmifilum uzonense]